MNDFDFDLFVIGAGSGGVRAARISSGYGAREIESEEIPADDLPFEENPQT